MRAIKRLPLSTVTFVTLFLTLASAAFAGGFSVFEQGAKAMGLAGAFTAQADDPTALFHNVGGLAFFETREMAAGITLVTSHDEMFVGAAPGPAAGSTGSLVSLAEPLPHFYWVQPVGRRWNFGLAVNSPFGLKSEWEDPDNFSGRFINTDASLLVVDLNPNLGIRLTENLGLGFGAIIRLSEVEFNRRLLTAAPPPFGQLEFASTRLVSDMEQGIGWQAGLLHRYNESFSWGLSYRSRIRTDYRGDAVFSQIATNVPALDDLLAATFPFDQTLPVETEIEFPDMASLGAAVALGPSSLLEVDINWTGWSSFDTLPIRFPGNPAFDIVRPEGWQDVYTYRFGLRLGRGSSSEWLFGFVTDESPQPTAAVSPLLPDADRDGYAFGWSHLGDGLNIDLSVMYLDFDPRTNGVSRDGFNGTYSQTGWLLAATLGF